jgi:hypothetical protein
MNAVAETAVIVAGVDSLALIRLLGKALARAAAPAPATPVPPALPPAGPATRPPLAAVPRSTANPGLAAAAAQRPRDRATGQFLPAASRCPASNGHAAGGLG